MLQNVLLFLLISSFNIIVLDATQTKDCPKYKSLWFSLKYPYTDSLSKLSAPKTFSNVCTASTCCDGTMENEIVAVSHIKLKNIAESHLQVMSDILVNASSTINGYLLANIDSSRQQLNQMFTNTYTYNYKMHQSFFFDFYDKLKQYVEGKKDGLKMILDNFFANMAERIVGMMVIAKKDPDTIRCLTNNLMKLDPYQGADKGIISAAMNSYPLTRMFVNSLKAANDVFMDLIKEKTTPSWDCSMLFGKTFFCSLCSGANAKPCESLCKSTIGQCLGSFNGKEISKISKTWAKLVVTLEIVSKKLINPFNLPEMNKNLHVKISDAIMNVHNFFPNVREKIWINCKTLGSRKRRSTDWINQFPSSQFNSNNQNEVVDIDLNKLIKTFSLKLPDMKVHLKRFRNILCSDEKSPLIGPNDKCWNGVSVSSGISSDTKQKKNYRNLVIDPVTQKAITKLNDINSLLKMMISGENKDPKAFKIEFVPKPKKPVNSRQRDDTVPILEGSGEVVTNAVSKKPIKASEPNPPNEDVVEGSGNQYVPPITENMTTEGPPSFPKLPIIESPVTMKPVPPSKNPIITDDEDMIDPPVDNTKPEVPNVKIEGSGKSTSKSFLPELPVVTTMEPVVIIETEATAPKAPVIINKPVEGSGFEESPDDENNKTPYVVHPQFPDLSAKSTPSAPVGGGSSQLSTVSSLIPHELPGDIPQEIWIPRAMDYDSYGRLVGVTTKTASTTTHFLFLLSFPLLFGRYFFSW